MPVAADVILGKGVIIPHPELVNLYGCRIGEQTKIGAFVEVQKNVSVGSLCKISSHSFICEGVTIGDRVFIGHGVTFINDPYPRATSEDRLQTDSDWEVIPTIVEDGASIGSASTILCGVRIGKNAMVGAGSVVTKNVPEDGIVVGLPGRLIGDVRKGARKR